VRADVGADRADAERAVTGTNGAADAARRIYALVRRRGTAAPSRLAIATLVLITVLVTGVALFRVARRHEIVRLGYELSRATARLREVEEEHRRLELERATLSSPDRIRALATSLGMVAAPPDRIRRHEVAPELARSTPP
jgi:cell division protein FtsL